MRRVKNSVTKRPSYLKGIRRMLIPKLKNDRTDISLSHHFFVGYRKLATYERYVEADLLLLDSERHPLLSLKLAVRFDGETYHQKLMYLAERKSKNI